MALMPPPSPPFNPPPYNPPQFKPQLSAQKPFGGGMPQKGTRAWFSQRYANLKPGQGRFRNGLLARMPGLGGNPTKPSPFPRGDVRPPTFAAGQGTPAPPFYPGPWGGSGGATGIDPYLPPPPQEGLRPDTDGEMWPDLYGGGPRPRPGVTRPQEAPPGPFDPRPASTTGGHGLGGLTRPYVSPEQVLAILMGIDPNQMRPRG